MNEWIGQGFALLGAAIFLAAGLGLWRLPDPYTRISAVATAAGLGVSCIIVGVVVIDPSGAAIAKGSVAIVLQLITSTIGGMTIARAAVNSGHDFSDATDPGPLAPEVDERPPGPEHA